MLTFTNLRLPSFQALMWTQHWTVFTFPGYTAAWRSGKLGWGIILRELHCLHIQSCFDMSCIGQTADSEYLSSRPGQESVTMLVWPRSRYTNTTNTLLSLVLGTRVTLETQ